MSFISFSSFPFLIFVGRFCFQIFCIWYWTVYTLLKLTPFNRTIFLVRVISLYPFIPFFCFSFAKVSKTNQIILPNCLLHPRVVKTNFDQSDPYMRVISRYVFGAISTRDLGFFWFDVFGRPKLTWVQGHIWKFLFWLFFCFLRNRIRYQQHNNPIENFKSILYSNIYSQLTYAWYVK